MWGLSVPHNECPLRTAPYSPDCTRTSRVCWAVLFLEMNMNADAVQALQDQLGAQARDLGKPLTMSSAEATALVKMAGIGTAWFMAETTRRLGRDDTEDLAFARKGFDAITAHGVGIGGTLMDTASAIMLAVSGVSDRVRQQIKDAESSPTPTKG